MKDFLIPYFTPYENTFFGWATCILFWLIALGLLFLLGWGIYYLLDYAFTTIETGQGIVIGRSYSPAWTEMLVISNGKNTSIVPVFHPEQWNLFIKIKYLTSGYPVSNYDYNHIPDGAEFNCTYSYGRLSHSLYIKSIR